MLFNENNSEINRGYNPTQRLSQRNSVKQRLISISGPCIRILYSHGNLVEKDRQTYEFEEDVTLQF
jgi:hypothetical protein